ncbi:MAG TPA: hypothetical protein VJW20_24975, partial [Candidatus Angelobacter sp.]|nr:hypothetical protein [Candidatus Angelobacter sp.]
MSKSKMLRRSILFVIVLALLCTGLLFAQKKPVRNISARRHPNLAAAQKLAGQAYEKIVAAQQANEWDLNGHAQKAKDLLDEVNR